MEDCGRCGRRQAGRGQEQGPCPTGIPLRDTKGEEFGRLQGRGGWLPPRRLAVGMGGGGSAIVPQAALLSGLMRGVRRGGRRVPAHVAQGQQEDERQQGPSPAMGVPACSLHNGATIGGGPEAVNQEGAGPPAAWAGDAPVTARASEAGEGHEPGGRRKFGATRADLRRLGIPGPRSREDAG